MLTLCKFQCCWAVVPRTRVHQTAVPAHIPEWWLMQCKQKHTKVHNSAVATLYMNRAPQLLGCFYGSCLVLCMFYFFSTSHYVVLCEKFLGCETFWVMVTVYLLYNGPGKYLQGWTVCICNQSPRSTQPVQSSRWCAKLSTGRRLGKNSHNTRCTSVISVR